MTSSYGPTQPSMLEIPWCGSLTAAMIVAKIALFGRFLTAGLFARYADTSPVPSSYEATLRHRFYR